METEKAIWIVLGLVAAVSVGFGLGTALTKNEPAPPAAELAPPPPPRRTPDAKQAERLLSNVQRAHNENDRLRSGLARLDNDLESARDERQATERKWQQVAAELSELREQYQVLARDLMEQRLANRRLADRVTPAPEPAARPLIVGTDVPADAARALGLDAAQTLSLNATLESEDRRLATAVRELIHREFPDKVGDEMENKSAAQLVVGSLLDKLMPEMNRVNAERARRAKAGEDVSDMTLWDVLGKDSACYKLAQVMRGARAKTYQELDSVLTPRQLSALRKDYLQPGNFVFPGNLNLGFPGFPAKAPEGR